MCLCIILCMENIKNYPSPLQILNTAKLLGITQEDISEATSISQSQISRLLSGHGKRTSKSYIKICNYVISSHKGISADDVRNNEELINALASVWDGSAQQSKAIANVILSLGGLCSISKQKKDR